MAQIMYADEFGRSAGPAADYRPAVERFAGNYQRRHHDAPGFGQQSQVDKLIADLTDIIVRASAASSDTEVSVDDATAEVVALAMMQALLDKEVGSSL